MATTLRDFLEIPYDKLEEMNLATKEARVNRTPAHKIREKHAKMLADEKRIKAVTVCFTDLEGRLHMLDYDKKFLLKSADNLTFDGSSIRGFSQQAESDLRLGIDWPAMLLAAVGRLRAGQGAGVRRRAREGRLAVRGRHAAQAQGVHARRSSPRTAPSSTPRTRSRASSSRAATPSGTITRPAASSSSARAATTTRCRATRCARSSTRPPKCSARWASPTRRTIRKWRRRSSR